MRKRNYTLPETDVAELKNVIRKDKRVEVVQRATAIKMLHDGQSVQRVAGSVLLSTTTVRYWFDRWLEHGVAGLETHPRSGRPPRLTPAYWEVIEKALATNPTTLGYTFTIWTLERLRDHAQSETGIRVNANYLSEQMKKQGYVYRRPRHDLRVHQDAAAREAARAQLEALKKTPNRGILHYSLWTKVP
jgi:transposase